MNIFILDYNPIIAAQMHCDKHVVKMILESFTMLSIAHDTDRKAWRNHPCSVWVRESKDNYKWLSILALALCEEYTYRYGKTHAKQNEIFQLYENIPNLPDVGCTPFAQAMPDDVKHSDTVTAYRQYYIKHKGHILKWKRRNKPHWA